MSWLTTVPEDADVLLQMLVLVAAFAVALIGMSRFDGQAWGVSLKTGACYFAAIYGSVLVGMAID